MRQLGAIGDQANIEENVTTGLSFIDSMKRFSRRLTHGTTFALTGARGYADDALPSPVPSGSQQSPAPAAQSLATTAVTARPASGDADRLRWVNQKDRRKMECTRSNLG